VDLDSAVSLVEGRRALLGGVVLSGGEPTLREELPEIVSRFKAMLIPVKIDTNGTRPEALAFLFADASTRPDYVAMDLKLAPERYAELAGPLSGTERREGSAEGAEASVGLAEAVARSAAILAASGVAHEFRSLAFPGDWFDETDLAALVPLVDDAPWYFAPFRPGNCLEAAWNDRSAGVPADAQRLAALARSFGKRGEVRSA
jgi:pyruvate formate lyase activating enzyme